jgi:hypothetical protein
MARSLLAFLFFIAMPETGNRSSFRCFFDTLMVSVVPITSSLVRNNLALCWLALAGIRRLLPGA